MVAILLVVALAAWPAACGGDGADQDGGTVASPVVESPTTSPTSAEDPADGAVLTLESREGTLALTLEDIRDLTPFTGWAGSKSQSGEIMGPDEYTGATLADLADLVGGVARGYTVTVKAANGCSVELSDE